MQALPEVAKQIVHHPLGMHNPAGIDTSVVPSFGPKPAFDSGVHHQMRASHKLGLRFQKTVEKACTSPVVLASHCPEFSYDEVQCGPWVYYNDAKGVMRFSQPDILLLNHALKQLVIIECKLRHTRFAWGQYKHYQGLLRLMYPNYTICGIEVCKSIDPMEAKAELVTSLQPHSWDFACYLWL